MEDIPSYVLWSEKKGRSLFRPLPRVYVKQTKWSKFIRHATLTFLLVWFLVSSRATTKTGLNQDLHSFKDVFRLPMAKRPAKEGLPRLEKDVCKIDSERLSKLNLTSDFTYAQRRVARIPLNDKRSQELWDGRNPAEGISEQLFPALININQSGTTADDLTIMETEQCKLSVLPMMVRYDDDDGRLSTPPASNEHSHLLFGVASTAERLMEAVDHLAHWLGHSGARLVIAVPQSPFVPLLRWQLEQQGVIVSIIISDEPDYLAMYFKLVVWLEDQKSAETKWITIIDDDTFYFSIDRFSALLTKYDHTTNVYIGAPSEDAWQMMRSGNFAFGGAGVTMSTTLLTAIQPFYELCKTYTKIEINDDPLGSDIRLARCITRNTQTRLSVEPDLHQVDLRGDVRGVLQGPRVPVNWHHYHSEMWGGLDVLRFAKSSPFCDAQCLFQRWKFTAFVNGTSGKSTVSSLHLGHSFVQYANGIDPNLAWYEMTWIRKPLSVYDHSLEPLRRPLEEGMERHTYFFETGFWTEEGDFIQTYIKRARPGSQDLDSVVELIWQQPR